MAHFQKKKNIFTIKDGQSPLQLKFFFKNELVHDFGQSALRQLIKFTDGSLQQKEMKAHICPIVKQIWLLFFMYYLQFLAFHKHSSLPLGRYEPSSPVICCTPQFTLQFQILDLGLPPVVFGRRVIRRRNRMGLVGRS